MRYYTVDTRMKESYTRVYKYNVYNIAAESEQKLMAIMNLVMDRGETLVDIKEDVRLNDAHQKSYESATHEILKRYSDRTYSRPAYWIRHRCAEEYEGCLIENYECSRCHYWVRDNYYFCPECGA